jgi:serine O-acetyltransferase
MVWSEIVDEARNICGKDVFLTDVMNHSIIDHASYSSAITALLAFHFDANITADKWRDLFSSVVNGDVLYNDKMDTVEKMGILDLQAIKERDPACDGLVDPFLYNKGFKALQAHRIAHILWRNGRKDVARAIQSRCSELYGLDIHPGATIGITFLFVHDTILKLCYNRFWFDA